MIIYDTYFNHDWNTREGNKDGKLNCSHFPTLRFDDKKYEVKTIHRIWNKGGGKGAKQLGYAVVVKHIPFLFKDLAKYDVLCRLDTGYGWQETKIIVEKLYKEVNGESKKCFVLMRYLTKLEIERMTEKIKSETQPPLPIN